MRGDARSLLGAAYVGHAGDRGDLVDRTGRAAVVRTRVGSDVPAGKDSAIRSPAAIDSGFCEELVGLRQPEPASAVSAPAAEQRGRAGRR